MNSRSTAVCVCTFVLVGFCEAGTAEWKGVIYSWQRMNESLRGCSKGERGRLCLFVTGLKLFCLWPNSIMREISGVFVNATLWMAKLIDIYRLYCLSEVFISIEYFTLVALKPQTWWVLFFQQIKIYRAVSVCFPKLPLTWLYFFFFLLLSHSMVASPPCFAMTVACSEWCAALFSPHTVFLLLPVTKGESSACLLCPL